MNKLDDILISDDPAHEIEIYLDCGAYWKQVNPQLPATLHDIYLQYPNAVMIYVIVDGFMSGVIYRCGNYGDGEWQQYAVTQGMAQEVKDEI